MEPLKVSDILNLQKNNSVMLYRDKNVKYYKIK